MAEARATWTDERLDDLSGRVEDGFRRVDARFDAMEARTDTRFAAVDARFDAIEARLDARFDALQRTMLQVGGGMIATVVFAGLIASGA